MPFFGDKQTHGGQIEASVRLQHSISQSDARELGITMCIEFFDAFNWNPARDQLRQDQDKFYQRIFSA